jgi:hypothetical protein
VGRWATGNVKPRDDAGLRIRVAFFAALVLVEAYGAETAKAWFIGTNAELGDNAPAWVLRHATDLDELQLVVPVAKEFASAGTERRADLAERTRFRKHLDGDGPGLPHSTGIERGD